MKLVSAVATFLATADAFQASGPRMGQSQVSMVFGLNARSKPAPAPIVEEEFCYGLPGVLAPVGEFDPLNLLNGGPWGKEPVSKAEVYRWREAELMHGRVAMMASAGFLVQESYHPLFGGQSGLETNYEMLPSIFDGIAAIDMLPLMYVQPALDVWWLSIVLGIFVSEGIRVNECWKDPRGAWSTNLQSLKDDHYPGDLGFDPLGLKPDDPEALVQMQNKELQNGRLAMIGALGFLAQESITHQPWLSVYQ